MKKSYLKWIFCLVLPIFSLGAAELKIEWNEPGEFRDADYYYNGGAKSKRLVTTNLERFFTRDAERFLQEGYALEMTITELDLAGDFEPWHNPQFNDVRIIKTIYPALIEFDYRLLDDSGNVVAEGSESLKDRMIPQSSHASFLGRSESYAYVKSIVRDWMRDLLDD